MRSTSILFFLFYALTSWGSVGETKLPRLNLNENLIKSDLTRILKAAKLPEDLFSFEFYEGPSSIKFQCQERMKLLITSSHEEKASSFYKALRELGFYFPHPRRQISPTLNHIKLKCGKTFSWRPKLKFRGFHLHTLHPNEWIEGFFGNEPKVAEDFIWWLARNNQNLLDISLLRTVDPKKLKSFLKLARELQIHTGVSLGIALQQQNSYKLLSVFRSLTGYNAQQKIRQGLNEVLETLPLSFIVLEAGTSEFTPTNFEMTLEWLNLAAKVTKKRDVALFTKIHVSSNQQSNKWGNYNFLPQYASLDVGILPHTVMFYGLDDEVAPMYGNRNFHAIRDFMNKEKTKRPTWYYPETSYWVGMDMDVPLLLTDYLVSRKNDLKNLEGIEGQLTFTSGQVLGYWLFDWNLALLIDSDYQDYPAFKFLNEDQKVWENILSYQTHWYKEKGLISFLSSANIQDELSSSHRIHERYTMKDLATSPQKLKEEVHLLEESLKAFPKFHDIKDVELKSLLSVTRLRQEHALTIRLALLNPDSKVKHLEHAQGLREEAKRLITSLTTLPTNYPELPLFKKWKNPTSYQFGYVYPAGVLYFWEREENQIRENSFFPFWNNLYDVLDILF